MWTREADEGSGPIRGRVAVVGRCAAGNRVLLRALQARGYDARAVAQEHSYVPDMWQRLSRPEVLIYLGVSPETVGRRRNSEYSVECLAEQEHRLRHARAHAQAVIETDDLDEAGVLARALAALAAAGVGPGGRDEED
jgi:hypothetical protein